MRKVLIALFLSVLLLPTCIAKETPFQILVWPDSGSPLLRFSFSKFKSLVGRSGKEQPYLTDTSAENLTDKTLSSVNLILYVFDKGHARIGEGTISLNNVGPHETVKFEITLEASGTPASLSLAASVPRNVSITINSVPQGATLKLDGKDLGTTPKLAEVAIGKHMLEFAKEGYNTGHFPLEMGPRDSNGGSVSFELGVSAQDTVELRDGSVLSGDLLSIDGTQVQLRIGGNIQTYDRNLVKRVSLTHRDPVPQ